MSQGRLPLVYGIAVDDYKTHVRHQIVNVKGNTLQYSVYCPSVDNRLDEDFNNNLLDVLNDKSALKSKAGREKAVEMFGKLLTMLKPKKQTGFVLGEEVLALTYDIRFDQSDAVEDIGMRLTRACMTQAWNTGKTDLATDGDKRNADKRILRDPRHRILNTWHDLMYAQHPVDAKTIAFEEVTKRTNRIIAKELYRRAVENGIGCLYRLDFEGNATKQDIINTKGKKNIIGSTLNVKDDLREYGDSLRLAMVPATASREYMDSVNIVSWAEWEKNGRNIFSAPLLKSIADFKTIKSMKLPSVA